MEIVLYDLVLKIAAELPNIDFKLVTSNIEKNQISTDNVKLINGHWQSNKISDTELRNYYQESKITIIPLKNTLQPLWTECCTSVDGKWYASFNFKNRWILELQRFSK